MIFRSPWPDVAIPNLPLSDFIFANVSQWAQLPAFIDGPSGRTLSHGEVHDAARRVAASLVQRGLRKGDVFAIVCPNVLEYAVAFHGVAMAGGTVTTANPLCTPEELAFQLNDSNARFLLTVGAFLDTARQAVARSRVQEVFVLGEAEGATPFAALLAGDGTPPTVTIDPAEDVVVLPYSSGTTGPAKGVMLTHRNVVAMLSQFEPLSAEVGGQRTLAVLPFFHAYGMQILMNRTLHRGITCVTMPRFDLQQFLQLIQQYRITTLWIVPPIVLALAKHPLVAQYDLSSLSVVGSGAAPLGDALQQAASERIKVPVRQGYGMTEAVITVSGWPHAGATIKPGAVGWLLPNVQARIVDVETGDDLGTNQRGELLVRGPNIMRGYLNNPDATAAMIETDGWMHTGDVAIIDDEGHLFIVDRLKELIKVKGFQVAPAHLEAVLLAHPAVADAAVIGIADDEAGEIPKAFVVLRTQTSADEIMSHVALHVAPYARLRALEFVDAIPKSPSGKILRRVLRERLQSTN